MRLAGVVPAATLTAPSAIIARPATLTGMRPAILRAALIRTMARPAFAL